MAQPKTRDREKEAFWRKAIREQGRRGESIRAYCAEHDLAESAFYFWRRELRRRERESPAEAAFLPVRVSGDAVPPDGRIEIVLAGGHRVRVVPPVDRQALADVLSVLEAGAC